MRSNDGSYRHYLPNLTLSIERNTGRVPSDGRFHIVNNRKVIASFRSRKKAEERFYQLVEESGYELIKPTDKPLSPTEEAIERYTLAKDLFWAEGPKYRPKGRRGGRGGV
ncbi:hypothetical protein ES703_96026 [subsurface metagenome]